MWVLRTAWKAVDAYEAEVTCMVFVVDSGHMKSIMSPCKKGPEFFSESKNGHSGLEDVTMTRVIIKHDHQNVNIIVKVHILSMHRNPI